MPKKKGTLCMQVEVRQQLNHFYVCLEIQLTSLMIFFL